MHLYDIMNIDYQIYIRNFHYRQSFIITEPPTVSTSHKNENETRSVKLIENVSVIDGYHAVHSVNWLSNGERFDIQARGRIHFTKSDKNPSLSIHNVNHQDAGSYRLIVTNAVWSDNSDIVFGTCNKGFDKDFFPYSLQDMFEV